MSSFMNNKFTTLLKLNSAVESPQAGIKNIQYQQPLITLTNIIKKYSVANVEKLALNSISLNINIGDMLAIVGTSGSGKSTLMSLIGLLDKADSGQYQLNGWNIQDRNNDELARLRNQYIGFVFQQFHLLPRFSALQNVALPLTYRTLSSQKVTKLAYEALERVGMQTFSAHRPMQLSGGQQQRIAIARALVGEPQLILADEPTGALDSNTSHEIMSLFLSLNKEGRTLILVTHDEQVALACKRRITLSDGKIMPESIK